MTGCRSQNGLFTGVTKKESVDVALVCNEVTTVNHTENEIGDEIQHSDTSPDSELGEIKKTEKENLQSRMAKLNQMQQAVKI